MLHFTACNFIQKSFVQNERGNLSEFISFQPILVSAIYENILFGNYNMISFGHKDLNNSNIGKIHQQVAK